MLEPRVIIIHDCRIYPCMQKNGVTVKVAPFFCPTLILMTVKH